MLDPSRAIAELLDKDRRYKYDAYVFVFEALSYAQSVLGMGTETASEPAELDSERDQQPEGPQRHVTGQDLCQAVRQLALRQYGYMAKTVLNSWGVYSTGDFGEIVFNLIRIGHMRKTPQDRREDFDNVYDFDTAFEEEFRITLPE
jgi:uncharacterized repeat protein (TIGR04138 family)